MIESVDLSAPLWILAEPEPGKLPWGMLAVRGGVELWNELGLVRVQGTLEIPDLERARSHGMRLGLEGAPP